jgi:hypothetical protein
LGIEVSMARREAISGMSASELTALLEGIKQQRRWPAH